MRLRYKILTAFGVAWLAASSAVAETPPPAAPTTIQPPAYVNPFDPNWWLATFNSLMQLYTVPMTTATSPNTVVHAAPASAGPVAGHSGSPYVLMQTSYGSVPVFNYADPQAWSRLFAQPFAPPPAH